MLSACGLHETKSDSPLIWALQGGFEGDNSQIRILCDLLGYGYALKHYETNHWARVPNLTLRSSLLSISRHDIDFSSSCRPPDMIIGSGRRSVPLMRAITKFFGGNVRSIFIGGPRAPLNWFDLILTTPQFRLPPDSHIVHLPLPLHAPPPSLPSSEESALRDKVCSFPRPHIGVFIGGGTETYVFTVSMAKKLIAAICSYARGRGGSLLVTTSPRTSSSVISYLKSAFSDDAPDLRVFLHIWQPHLASGILNPYGFILHDSDEYIVTGDSISMLADAMDFNRPLMIFDNLPVWRIFREFRSGFQDWCARYGFWSPAPNHRFVHELLYLGGHAVPLGAPFPSSFTPIGDYFSVAVERARLLLE